LHYPIDRYTDKGIKHNLLGKGKNVCLYMASAGSNVVGQAGSTVALCKWNVC